jgi:alkanesulfonate monooxygenase SsuD/methylene tetrahydromethanopterin reductase-like flavin-dependent oxidoreductase (luciferase family)
MVTERIRLGTFVSSPNYRHPVTFLRDLLALDDISGGRVLCGLGTGGDLDSRLLGDELALRDRVARFAEFTALLDRLLREDHVDHVGDFYRSVDARTLPGPVQQPRIPFVVAANGPRSLRLAARYGQGWVTTGRRVDTLDEWWGVVGELVGRLDEALEAEGRDPAELDRYLSLDASPQLSLESVGAFQEMAGRADQLGFTDVISHWPRAEGVYAASVRVLEAVAEQVLAPGRR